MSVKDRTVLENMMSASSAVDGYFERFDGNQRHRLDELRALTRKLIPDGIEVISYGIPTMKLGDKNVVHYAAYRDHVGVYPIPNLDDETLQELQPYIKGKGTSWFALDQPIPTMLVTKLILALLARTAK